MFSALTITGFELRLREVFVLSESQNPNSDLTFLDAGKKKLRPRVTMLGDLKRRGVS